jgi:hypothetical protein
MPPHVWCILSTRCILTTRIQAHSSAFSCIHSHPHSLVYAQMYSLAFVCIRMHSYVCIRMHIYIYMHLYAFLCQFRHEHPAQLRKLGSVLGRAAHLGRQLVDGLRRDGAVLVGHICVLLACFFFSRAGTFEMHQAENVLECVKFYTPQDQFPGNAGERYSWFVDITPPPPSEGPAVLAAARDGPTSTLRVTALRSVSLTCPPRPG